jgi:cobalamin biosynthesis protein CobC
MFSSLHHGGRLRAAAHAYRIPLQDWLDLSTGITPEGWPVPLIPNEVWRRLPEDDDGLAMATRAYFGGALVLPVAGSQAAIQTLPRLYTPRRVAILSPCYAEHEKAWREAGHMVDLVDYAAADAAARHHDVLLLTNPNNPTGQLTPVEQLTEWHTILAKRGGLLVVDEAFIDASPQLSLLARTSQPGLVVLRSLGKFFGLAGLRCGFVAAEEKVLGQLNLRLGPWAVSHPARWVAQRALADRPWQMANSQRLLAASQRLADLLAEHGLPSPSGCGLFRWVPCPQPGILQDALARKGILVRAFEKGLRFGLPGTESDWLQLTSVLREVML